MCPVPEFAGLLDGHVAVLRDEVSVLARQFDVAAAEGTHECLRVLGVDAPVASLTQLRAEVHRAAGETDSGENPAGLQQPAPSSGGEVVRDPHICRLAEPADNRSVRVSAPVDGV